MLKKQSPEDYCEQSFKGATLGNKCRNRRCIQLATRMAKHPGRTLPQLSKRFYDVKATYALFKRPEATVDNLQAGHRQWVRAQMLEPGEHLLVEDDSNAAWADTRKIKGLGPVNGNEQGGQGFVMHTVLAMHWVGEPSFGPLPHRPAVHVEGIADQQFVILPRKLVVSPHHHERAQSTDEFITDLWEKSTNRLGDAPKASCVRWTRVADRGADIYEFVSGCKTHGYGFVVRASQLGRALVDPKTGHRSHTHLREKADAAPCLASFKLELRERPQHPARTAHLCVSAVAVSLASPQRPGHPPGTLPPIDCWVVRVWEPSPLDGVESLEWYLLTDRPVTTFLQALRVSLQYTTRWVVEEFHKGLKTGLGLERLHLEEASRLEACAAIMSVVSLRLLDLREHLRISPQAPAAESGLDELELKILAAETERTLKTVQDVALAVGSMGGHLGRKRDGMPGWQSLTLGLTTLLDMVAGARLAARLGIYG